MGMIMRYKDLKQHQNIFLKMTGLRISEFDRLLDEVCLNLSKLNTID